MFENAANFFELRNVNFAELASKFVAELEFCVPGVENTNKIVNAWMNSYLALASARKNNPELRLPELHYAIASEYELRCMVLSYIKFVQQFLNPEAVIFHENVTCSYFANKLLPVLCYGNRSLFEPVVFNRWLLLMNRVESKLFNRGACNFNAIYNNGEILKIALEAA